MPIREESKVWHGETDIAEYSCSNSWSQDSCSNLFDDTSNGEPNIASVWHTFNDKKYAYGGDAELKPDEITITFKVNLYIKPCGNNTVLIHL